MRRAIFHPDNAVRLYSDKPVRFVLAALRFFATDMSCLRVRFA
jgi:hypothetical protein